jgi:hypothetical protein
MYFPFYLHSAVVFDSYLPRSAPAVPMPCHDHAVLKATSQGHGIARHGRGIGKAWYVCISIGHTETACRRSARFRFLPATTRSSTKVVTTKRVVAGLAFRLFPCATRNFTKVITTKRVLAGLAFRLFPCATRSFTKDTALSENGRGAARHV